MSVAVLFVKDECHTVSAPYLATWLGLNGDLCACLCAPPCAFVHHFVRVRVCVCVAHMCAGHVRAYTITYFMPCRMTLSLTGVTLRVFLCVCFCVCVLVAKRERGLPLRCTSADMCSATGVLHSFCKKMLPQRYVHAFC